MARCVLFAGQSLPNAFCTWGSSTMTAHPDTHMWNGSGWSAPVGYGAITYANCLREALQEPIYLVNACVDGTPLLNYGGAYWSATGAGSLAANAIAKTQAALASVPGLALDRIEWWQGQTDCMSQGYDMYSAPLSALSSLLSTFRSGLGNDFRFCVWPVGKVSSGSTAQFIRAQMVFSTGSNAPALGVEPGPASYDRSYGDGVHLASAYEYSIMAIRAARNAVSYFVAKANNALTIPHYGAGPQVVELLRNPSARIMLAKITAKTGFRLASPTPWTVGYVIGVTGCGVAWGIGDHASLTVEGAEIAGGYLRVQSSTVLQFPVWMSYQQERTDNVQWCVYDDNDRWIGGSGQPMLPHVFGMTVSA